MRHGFDLGYKIRVHHGEPDLPPPPPVIDNTRQPKMSDMTTLLKDLTYIPLNNEHNEPTQGDIGETSNEPTQDTRNDFKELYVSANAELYPGCDYVTRLDFMAKFTYFKVKGKLTDSIFNEMLEFFQNVFLISKGYKLPPSYYAIKKTFNMIGLGYESIHACEHDCCLFRGYDNKDLDFCPVCNTSRWKDSNTPGNHTAKEMIWHATGKCTEPDKMQHPVDGRAWKKFDTKYLNFAKEPRNVRLGLATAGFNPFGNLKSSFILTLLIPGPKSLGKDIDVYLRPLIKDLKVLWDQKGVETIDVALGQKFNMRAMVLWTINDFPARSSLYGWSRQDTAKARQDLERLGIQSGLWLGQTKNEKCLKPQATYSFTPENQKKFCQFIKEVKIPDGFRSCFKHKVTDNDTNIMGLKSHDCHIMMQRLLPYGLQQYLPNKIAKPIIELCSLFKQICSITLMDDDMLKAQIKVVDILCDLELIYPPALFDIMIHLVIHLPLKDLKGGPIHPRWMFPFERYIKKLKGYVRNKAKPEGSIAEGYVAEEALTFSSHYFQDVTRSTRTGPSSRVDGVRYVLHSCNERRTTQNSDIFSPGHDGEMYYGQLQEILEFKYLLFKVVLFRVKPSLIRGRTWNPPTRERSTLASSSTCKKRTIPTRLLLSPSIGL
nr:hypothetical protein [Tanacetum cinerariifolium]